MVRRTPSPGSFGGAGLDRFDMTEKAPDANIHSLNMDVCQKKWMVTGAVDDEITEIMVIT